MKLRFSIRWRLTLWYAAVILVTQLVVSGLIYQFMSNRLQSELVAKVDTGYAVVEAVVKNSGGDLYDIVHLGQNDRFLLTKNGAAVYVTSAWDETGLPRELDRLERVTGGQTMAPDGRVFQTRTGYLAPYGYTLSYAVDATDSRANLRTLVMILLAAVPVALILGVVGGYFLAGRALAPLETLTRRAREITAESLSQRLPVENPGDELGRLAAVFNDTLARLEDSFERLRRFTADASHELRTPLTAIRSVGEVALQHDSDGETAREALSSILVETEHLHHLLENLLTLARGDAGRTQLKPRPTDIAALAGRVTEDLRVLAEEKNQTVELTAPADVWAPADSPTLQLALMNVIHNAIRYTPERGSIRITVCVRDGSAIIDTVDSGPGIQADDRERVFERFYRVGKARSRADGGAGLGLAIARWAVEINGGTIAFVDSDSPGACCRIRLPIV